MRHEKFVATTFILLGVTSFLLSLAILYFVVITSASVEALIPPDEDVSTLNLVFGVGYLFALLEFLLGVVSIISAYKIMKKRRK